MFVCSMSECFIKASVAFVLTRKHPLVSDLFSILDTVRCCEMQKFLFPLCRLHRVNVFQMGKNEKSPTTSYCRLLCTFCKITLFRKLQTQRKHSTHTRKERKNCIFCKNPPGFWVYTKQHQQPLTPISGRKISFYQIRTFLSLLPWQKGFRCMSVCMISTIDGSPKLASNAFIGILILLRFFRTQKWKKGGDGWRLKGVRAKFWFFPLFTFPSLLYLLNELFHSTFFTVHVQSMETFIRDYGRICFPGKITKSPFDFSPKKHSLESLDICLQF